MLRNLLISVIVGTSLAREITNSVKNQTHIVCITKDDSPAYVEPLELQEARNLSLVLEANESFKNTGWKLKNSKTNTQGPILDKRWEDLEIVYGDIHRFTYVSSLSFSVYGASYIKFCMDDVRAVERFSTNLNASVWHHYTIVSKGGNTYIFENFLNSKQSSDLVRSAPDITLVDFVVKTNNKAFWKIHDYTYWHSETTSSVPTDLAVSSEIGECVMIYMSLCDHCCLHIVDEESTCGRTNRTSSNTMFSLEWQNLKIDSAKSLKFIRNTTDGSSDGHWSIDIRRCPRFSNEGSFIYETITKSTNNMNSTCKILNNGTIQMRSKRNVKYDISDCDVGFFGYKCNISCESLLGSEEKYCQGHQICQDDDCNCAWGFEGRFCNKSCQLGYWGVSCKKICPANCRDNCNRSTGVCKDEEVSSEANLFGMWWITISLIVVLLMFVIVTVLIRYVPTKRVQSRDRTMDNAKLLNDRRDSPLGCWNLAAVRGLIRCCLLERTFLEKTTKLSPAHKGRLGEPS